jgi:hypothetical protein
VNGSAGAQSGQRRGQPNHHPAHTGRLSDRYLLLNVMFGRDSVSWNCPITEPDKAVVENMRADPTRIATIKSQIVAALHDDARPMHENQTYCRARLSPTTCGGT